MPPPPIPVAPLASATPQPDYFANGPFLVMRKTATLPDRCIHCNSPAEGQTFRKRLLWADLPKEPTGGLASRLFVLVKFVYAVQDMLRFIGSLRTVTFTSVYLPICARHFRSRCLWNPIAWLAIPAGIAAAVLIQDIYLRIWMPFLGVAVTMLAHRLSHHIAPAHIGITHVTLRGAGAAFLDSLPPREPPKAQPPDVGTIVASTSELKDRMKARRGAL